MKPEENEKEEETEIENLFEAEEERDKHSTKLRLNASNLTNLDIFNMNVLSERRKLIMQKWKMRWNKKNERMNSC